MCARACARVCVRVFVGREEGQAEVETDKVPEARKSCEHFEKS